MAGMDGIEVIEGMDCIDGIDAIDGMEVIDGIDGVEGAEECSAAKSIHATIAAAMTATGTNILTDFETATWAVLTHG